MDFPGAISFGTTLDEAREMLASALVDMAETNLLMGEPLPRPQPGAVTYDVESDIEEPVDLVFEPHNHPHGSR